MLFVNTAKLRIAYQESGDPAGTPTVLLHGFPYDIHAYDQVTPLLISQGHRVIVPYLRGYGPTRFLSDNTLRSGQQAALGKDLLDLMNALSIEKAILAGYDWGGRAACIVAALRPERVLGLVTGCGYNIQNIATANDPDSPENEYNLWYQYYFHSDRGRQGLKQNREAFCKLLWKLWSPDWNFNDPSFQQSASAFNNPDFVDVVIHSYRHRFGLVAGDPLYKSIEILLAKQPSINVPTINLHGESDGIFSPETSADHQKYFTHDYQRRVLHSVGHNLPQEAPAEFAEAILSFTH